MKSLCLLLLPISLSLAKETCLVRNPGETGNGTTCEGAACFRRAFQGQEWLGCDDASDGSLCAAAKYDRSLWAGCLQFARRSAEPDHKGVVCCCWRGALCNQDLTPDRQDPGTLKAWEEPRLTVAQLRSRDSPKPPKAKPTQALNASEEMEAKANASKGDGKEMKPMNGSDKTMASDVNSPANESAKMAAKKPSDEVKTVQAVARVKAPLERLVNTSNWATNISVSPSPIILLNVSAPSVELVATTPPGPTRPSRTRRPRPSRPPNSTIHAANASLPFPSVAVEEAWKENRSAQANGSSRTQPATAPPATQPSATNAIPSMAPRIITATPTNASLPFNASGASNDARNASQARIPDQRVATRPPVTRPPTTKPTTSTTTPASTTTAAATTEATTTPPPTTPKAAATKAPSSSKDKQRSREAKASKASFVYNKHTAALLMLVCFTVTFGGVCI